MGEVLGYAFADTPVGRIIVVTTERGVVAIEWGDTDGELLRILGDRFPQSELVHGENDAIHLAAAVASLADDPFRPSDEVPLDLDGTDFQKQVWEAMRTVPPGRTVSYAALAAGIGRPRAYRAVAQACARNPSPIVVPCHRVVGSGGKLGGFSGGLWRKKVLLQREGSLPGTTSQVH